MFLEWRHGQQFGYGLVQRSTAQPPRTFSIGFDDPRYNEIEYARIAARHFSADHHEYFVKPEDIPVLVEKAVQVYDEPFGNSSIVPTYYCAVWPPSTASLTFWPATAGMSFSAATPDMPMTGSFRSTAGYRQLFANGWSSRAFPPPHS